LAGLCPRQEGPCTARRAGTGPYQRRKTTR